MWEWSSGLSRSDSGCGTIPGHLAATAVADTGVRVEELSRDTVLGHRMRRQAIHGQVSDLSGYLELTGRLQPVAPQANSMPGSPPRLLHRVSGDDAALADELRGRRELVKGRFWGGQIGYVLSADMGLYARAYRRPLSRLNVVQEQVYQALWDDGALTPRQIKRRTGLLNRQVMPALHRLQQAFMVYEAQEDSDWERPWSIFSASWPDVGVLEDDADSAAREVLLRFVRSQVWVSLQMLRDGCQFAARRLLALVAALEDAGELRALAVRGMGEGWVLSSDAEMDASVPQKGVVMLHRADPLVRCRITELKERFDGRETLQYLLIDGDLRGAVCGHWRIGPHDVDDIALDLPNSEVRSRRVEIIAAVTGRYRQPESRVRAYAGEPQ
jgi:hypothetical protein